MSPKTIQTVPIGSVTGSRAITTTQAARVPSPPITAVSGHVEARMRGSSVAASTARGSSGRRLRSRITATCAIVNESIAPNEYIVARQLGLARQGGQERRSPEKTMIAR